MATEEITVENMRLGKGGHRYSPLTLMISQFFKKDEVRVPDNHDFDKRRREFPVHIWGNEEYGDCVIAGEANQLVRMERVEQWRTVPLYDEDVITRYKGLTGCVTPSDENDTGLVVLDSLRDWRANGFAVTHIPKKRRERVYKISAYGELDIHDRKQLREANYILHGVQFGFSLPAAAVEMTKEGTWHYEGQTGSDWQPGSWGGHLVYSKAFSPEFHEVLSWGQKIKVSNEFVEKYADEAWGVVDSLDSWRIRQTINVEALTERLSQISKVPINR